MLRLIVAWYKNIIGILRSPEGWVLISKIVIVLATIFGYITGYAVYKMESKDRAIQRAEVSFYRFSDQISSSDVNNRVAAITNIPNLLVKKVPVVSSDEMSLFRMLFRSIKKSAIYERDVKSILYKHVKSIGISPGKWSHVEMKTVIDILIKLGPDGWYEGKIRDFDVKPQNGLKWIWEVNTFEEKDIPVSSLFTGSFINNISLAHYDLTNSIFNYSKFQETDLRYSNIKGAQFLNTLFGNTRFEWSRITENSDFSNMVCLNTDFSHSIISKSKFISSQIIGSTFDYLIGDYINWNNSTIRNSIFYDVELEYSDFSGAIISNSDFSNSTLSRSRFISTNMDTITFINTLLVNMNMRSSIMKSVKFNGSTILNSNFEAALLIDVDFSDAVIDTLSIWTDANLFSVQGLSKQGLENLLKKGAVIIPSLEEWQRYKSDGRPHDRWMEYTK